MKDITASVSLKSLRAYWELMRFHQPIGIFLLLFPTYWALWLAVGGVPSTKLLIIFTLGVIVMRAAGCVINDIADRDIDKYVERTKQRPITSGRVSVKAAYILFFMLLMIAFLLVLMTNAVTIYLSFVAVVLAFCYPFMKRYTHLPQVVLGAAFSMSIPMAFAAVGNMNSSLWLVYIVNLLWTLSYDTLYGMTDREHDKKIGVKSTAILFEENDRLIIGGIQGLTIVGFIMIGQRFELNESYYLSVIFAALLMAHQQWVIRYRQASACFNAFVSNHWVGLVIFVGIMAHFAIR